MNRRDEAPGKWDDVYVYADMKGGGSCVLVVAEDPAYHNIYAAEAELLGAIAEMAKARIEAFGDSNALKEVLRICSPDLAPESRF